MGSFDRKALSQNQERAQRYRAGMTEEMHAYLENRGISRLVADRFMLGRCDDVHEGWLAIPYLRPSGVVWFNYRRMDDGKPKYMASGQRHLFNTAALDQADQTGEVAVSEGELDAIVATASGVPCVGVPGATQWVGNPAWRELFVGYQRVWILADPDDAGLGFAQSIMDVLPAARLVKLPGDVTDTLLAGRDVKEFMK